MPEFFDRGPMEIRKEQIDRQLELLGVETLETRYDVDEIRAAAWKLYADGSFASAIADSFFAADSHNRGRLLRSFPDLFLRHLDKKDKV